jgi:hypothetical protein
MTENKLRTFISKPREPPSGKRTHQPILLTDSKGNYLKKYACHDVEKQIVETKMAVIGRGGVLGLSTDLPS